MFASRHPLYEDCRQHRGAVWVIEGGVGVGKSTTGQSLSNKLIEIGLNARFFPEYVNRRLLKQFIDDMKTYAYSFQMIMLFKRIEIYNDAERFAATGGIAIIDRSIIGDKTFAYMQMEAGNISADEWETYLSIMKEEIRLVPSASIFLKCSVKTSMDRIRARGNLEEIKGYSEDYIGKLLTAYDRSISECTNVKHVIVDWNKPVHIVDGHLDDDTILFLLKQLI